MQGFRFFSIFIFLFLSLFIQKTCDLSSVPLADETITASDKRPVIQTGSEVKFITKKKSHQSVYLFSGTVVIRPETNITDEKILFLFSNLPKLSSENPSRAPPVV